MKSGDSKNVGEQPRIEPLIRYVKDRIKLTDDGGFLNDFIKLGIGAIVMCVMGFALSTVSMLLSRPPEYSSLVVRQEVVTSAMQVDSHSRARRYCIPTAGGCYRIPFWQPDLESRLGAIRQGDAVQLYLDGDDAWQVLDGNEKITTYADTLAARDLTTPARFIFPICAGIVGSLLTIIGLVLRSRMKAS